MHIVRIRPSITKVYERRNQGKKIQLIALIQAAEKPISGYIIVVWGS